MTHWDRLIIGGILVASAVPPSPAAPIAPLTVPSGLLLILSSVDL